MWKLLLIAALGTAPAFGGFGSVDNAGLAPEGGEVGTDPANGDCILLDDNGMQGCVRGTDAAPNDVLATGQTAYPQASSNKNGANLDLAAGLGSKTVTIDDYNNCGTDTVTITVDGAATVLTEASEWTAATDNDTTAASLATAITAVSGVTATSTAAVVYITKADTTVTVSLAEGDATCTTVANNTDGDVYIWHNLELKSSLIDTNGGYIYDSTASLAIGGACTAGHGFGSGTVCFAGGLDINGTVYFDTTIAAQFANGGRLYLGGSATSDSRIIMDGPQTQLILSVGSTQGRQLVITDSTNSLKNHDHAAATDPYVYIHSVTDPDTNNTQWIGFGHDQTNGIIDVGTGTIELKDTLQVPNYTVDQHVIAGSATLGSTAPGYDVNASCAGIAFDETVANETVTVAWEIPSCWIGTTDITFKIYWCNENGDALQQNEAVKFDVSYRSLVFGTETADNGTVATGTVTYTETANPGNDGDTHVSEITLTYNHADQPLTTDDVVLVEISRDEGVASDYSGDTIIPLFAFGFTANKICDHY